MKTPSFLRRLLLVALPLFLTASFAQAQAIYTPKEGSAERKEIMDNIRTVCEKDLQQKVIFVVNKLKANDEYVVAHVTPVKPDGSKIDYTQTKYREKIAAGTFDDSAHVLLRKNDKGHWEWLEYVFGDKAAAKVGWADGYGLPDGMRE